MGGKIHLHSGDPSRFRGLSRNLKVTALEDGWVFPVPGCTILRFWQTTRTRYRTTRWPRWGINLTENNVSSIAHDGSHTSVYIFVRLDLNSNL